MSRRVLLLATALLLLLAWRRRRRVPYIVTTPEANVLVPNDPDTFDAFEAYFRSLEEET